jgi:hypothetical protein
MQLPTVKSIKGSFGLLANEQKTQSSTRQFADALKSSGFAYSHLFSLIFSKKPDSVNAKLLELYATDVSIPGMNVSTKNYRLGNRNIEMPYDFNYDNTIQVTFMADADQTLYLFFYKWMNTIVDHSSEKAGYQFQYINSNETNVLGTGYASKISIGLVANKLENLDSLVKNNKFSILDKLKSPSIENAGALAKNLLRDNQGAIFSESNVTLFEIYNAYPKTISHMNLNNTSAGIQKFTITFAFDRYEIKQISTSELYGSVDQNIMDYLERFIMTTAGTIASQLKAKVIGKATKLIKTKWL